MAIKVRAIDIGHYGHLRQPDEEFEIKDEKAFSSKWMEKVDEDVQPLKPLANKKTPATKAQDNVI